MTGNAIAALAVAYLDEHRCGTVQEIARAIRVRDAEVRRALKDDPRFSGPFTVGKAPHAQRVFFAPHEARDSLGRAT